MNTRCTFVSPMRGLYGGTRCHRDAVVVESEYPAGERGPNDYKSVCQRHATMLRKRREKREAPHVHKAWASGVRVMADGSIVRFCADCGANF